MPTMIVDKWETTASKIPERCSGDYCIVKKKIDSGTAWSMEENDKDIFGYDSVLFTKPVIITGLEEETKENDKNRIWMTDSPREHYSMWELNARTEGKDVVVGGLGLGDLANLLANRKDIENITVVEKSKDVINLTKDYVNPRVRIEEKDFFEKIEELSKTNSCPSTIIMDIYSGEEDSDDVYMDYSHVKDLCPDSKVLVWNYQPYIEEEEELEYYTNYP